MSNRTGNMVWLSGFGLLLLSSLARAGAEPLEVEARFAPPPSEESSEKQNPRVGEPIRIIIEAKHQSDNVALLPEQLKLPAPLVERRAARGYERQTEGAIHTDRYTVELLSFEAGRVDIPPLPLSLGSTVTQSNGLWIEVQSNLNPSEQQVASSTQAEALPILEQMLAENPEPAEIWVDDYWLIWAALGGLFGLILVWLLITKLKQRPTLSPAFAPPPPPRPPHIVALERLAELEASEAMHPTQLKRFYTELSFILRAYLQGRYQIDALESTARELIAELRASVFENLPVEMVTEILSEADLVKYAKYQPEAHHNINHIQAVRTIVNKTKQEVSADD